MRRALGVWVLMMGLCLVGGTGCDESPPDEPTVDAGQPDAGNPDAGNPDAGNPGGDAGTPVAHVRFVNAFLGLKDNPSDSEDAPWKPFKVNVYQGGTKLFSAPVEPGDEAVTDYVTVVAGTSIRFEVRDTEAPATATPVATSEALTLKENSRVTLVGVGFLHASGDDRFDKPRLLVLKEEELAAADKDSVRLRFVTAGRAVTSDQTRRLAVDGQSPFVTLAPFSADSAQGASLSKSVQRLVVSAPPPDRYVPSQGGRLSFSLPSQALASAGGWFAILTGDDRRPLPDEGEAALLLVPAGKRDVLRLKRDPLLYFFHAVMPDIDGNDPVPLQVLNGERKVAAEIYYGYDPTIGELPVTATGHSLKVTLDGDDGTVVLDAASTGPLEAGRRYLVVMSGKQGQTGDVAPRLTVIPDGFPADVMDARVRFVDASMNAPSRGVDFGYFDVASDGSKGDTFTSVVQGAKYATIAGSAAGVPFLAPLSRDSSNNAFMYYGIRAAEGGPAKAVKGGVVARPHLVVLIGDWNQATLEMRALNLRNNWWVSLSAPGTFE
ncbi:DUF4397 domain-containing protein [Archangium lipolyticum]|uniref:DUF4397 domain-containing protein n=1 Tax=Archangium lipolyticum TaxID=2970465 RepID=UPI00214A702F|nr:DUF4397 domain-containing protein [Archangium lipolyticum]